MKSIKSLAIRYRQTIFLFIVGLILIIYISLGFLYLQQGPQQRDYENKITTLSAIVANPLPSNEKLEADYAAVIQALAPITPSEAIEMLVSLAEENGLNIDKNTGKFRVPTASISKISLGENTYELISFGGIQAQGDYDNIMAFVSALDSGTRLETMVLTRVTTREVEVTVTGEEGNRREEFRRVISAVQNMMIDNGLATIPNPVSFRRGTATYYMGDNVSTTTTIEGFPDITTSAADKGYNGNNPPNKGYVLYRHDKISSSDTTQYETINYFTTSTTKNFYTCEADGTVRQWDGPNVTTAIEYLDSQGAKTELAISLDVKIYTSP
ncbi:MAG: hypothetical protein V3R96_00285 [Dehalococcoidales bacterium]